MPKLPVIKMKKERLERIKSIQEELSKNELVKGNDFIPRERVSVNLSLDADQMFSEFLMSNFEELRDKYNINSRNKLMTYILEKEVNKLSDIFDINNKSGKEE